MRVANADRGALFRASIAGVVVPILLVVAVTVLGFLEPDYSHRTRPMSVLGGVGGWRGLTFNTTVVVGGALIAVFNLGFRRVRPTGKLATTGIVLLFVGAVGMALAGAFHCNEGCTNALREPTIVGRIHVATAFLAGLGLGLAPLLLVAPMRRDPRWRSLAWATLVLGVLGNVPGIAMWISLVTVRLPEWEGLMQRLAIIFSLVWIARVAVRLRSLRAG